jgi:hypothetical protein
MSKKLSEFALLAEVIGGLGVILSLIFLGYQVNDSAKATRSATANSAIASISAWYAGMGQSDQTSANFLNAMTNPETLSREEWFQFTMNFHAAMLNFQNSYYLVDEGTLDAQIRDSLTAVIGAAKDLPGFAMYWQQRRSIFFDEFQHYIDGILASDIENSEGLYKPLERVEAWER